MQRDVQPHRGLVGHCLNFHISSHYAHADRLISYELSSIAPRRNRHLHCVPIGQGTIVGTGSSVTKLILAYQVWGGVPAKFIKHRP